MRKIFILVLIVAGFTSCIDDNELMFEPVGTIDKLVIRDIVPMSVDTLLVLGQNEENYTEVYLCKATSSGLSSTKRCRSKIVYNTICFNEGKVWMGGEDMNLRRSSDTAKNVPDGGDLKFTFTDWRQNWPAELSNLKGLSAKDGNLQYMYGTDDLFTGNFYVYESDDTVFSSTQTQCGLNDMLVYNNDVYLAGYGNIFHVTENGQKMNLENIGGENFTGITIVDNKFLFACTYSGKVFRSEVGSGEWEKVYNEGKKLLHIQANKYGDVVASGENKDLYISNDSGTNWRKVHYDEGNKITYMGYIADKIYIGTEKGTIIRLSHDGLSIHD